MKTSKNHKWIYTYDYAPFSLWEEWRTAPTQWIDDECETVAKRVNRHLFKMALLADSHYTIHGTWEDTAASLYKLHTLLKLDGVVHLGDLTDGMLPQHQTQELEDVIKEDLSSLKIPVHIVPGNHDYNYFRGNTELVYPQTPQYYVDYHEQKLRLIFIDSFDPKEQARYGFTEYCIYWLESLMNSLPKGYCCIIFSHVPPLVRLQAWAKEIRNREKLMKVLDSHSHNILAFINGHNHCDYLFNDLYNGNFPIISINCAKCECFLEHKPEDAVVPYRQLGDRTQESFDIMAVDTDKREIYFTRFGSGNDRVVRNGKAVWDI